ncbi:LysE family translocator [Acinetobacter larvae]|uniref:Multidrug transporter MatE n=1 Tax=Acinetobacter larvae TaxID=1789224 RepID=A0A1B2LWT6_9GAMM|nr:LysE family translocator [Acinetobacter larvae]AOA57401.1 multidrug transporter MatE [Acinetobacter larvae]
MISLLFIGLVVTILLTPGPTNTLLASSGIQIGVRPSLNLIPAEAFGYIISITLWGALVGTLSKQYPLIPDVLKLFSATYILYLAIKLWRSPVEDIDNVAVAIKPRELFFATLLNPKALLFASAIFPAYAWQNFTAYSLHMLVFILLILPIAFFWITLGSILAKRQHKFFNQNNLQKMASIVLMIFCIPLGFSAINNLQL